MFQGIDRHIADSAFTFEVPQNHVATTVRPIWTVRKKEEDPQIQFPSIRGHPCGNKTTRADVPGGAKIDVLTQESCAFVVLSEILGFSAL